MVVEKGFSINPCAYLPRLCQGAQSAWNKGVAATLGWAADTISGAQNKAVLFGSWVFTSIDEGTTKLLVGCHQGQILTGKYRFHNSLVLVSLTVFCGFKALESLGLSWKYLPIPIFRSRKIVTITSVKLPGDDVSVDKVREDERRLEKAVGNFTKAAFWTAGFSLGCLTFYSQISNARNANGEEGVCLWPDKPPGDEENASKTGDTGDQQ